MSNIFKQVESDVRKFKSRHIAPQILIDSMPKFKEEYEKAMDEYRKTDLYKKKVETAIKNSVAYMIQEVCNDDTFRRKIKAKITAEVLKELKDGN